MHSLEMYSIRIYDNKLAGTLESKYAKLDKVRGHNIADIIEDKLVNFAEYVDMQEEAVRINPGVDLKSIPKKLYSVSNCKRAANTVYGILSVGDYGVKSKIVNRKSSLTVGQVNVDDSVMFDHFFYFQLRPGKRKAILLIQAIHGRGVKGIFEQILVPKIREVTKGLVAQMRPLGHKALVKEWFENAELCELRLSRFASNDSINDITDKLDDAYAEVRVRPKKRRARLGKISSLDNELLDILKNKASSVSAQLEYNGRKRLFKIDSNEDPISSVELDEEDPDIDFKEGNPTFQSALKYAEKLATDLWPTLDLEDSNG